MTHGSLFSGIGGFDLAAEWMGWENVFHCEINEYCQKILKQHFTNAESYKDITTTDFSRWRGRVDVVSGGFPCQPYSQAGKRKGKQDDRHLWPEMLRAIREIQPAWIVGENVPGLLNWERGVVLAEIYADLEASGFEVFPPVILPACGKNAPHRRDRLWIIAHANGKQRFEGSAKEPIQRKPDLLRLKPKRGFEDFRNRWDLSAPRTCRNNDGVSNVVDRIKALGNAVVPQLVLEIFKVIDSMHKNNQQYDTSKRTQTAVRKESPQTTDNTAKAISGI